MRMLSRSPGFVSQVSDVPVNERVVNIACVDSHVGEMTKDVVKGPENLRHSFRLSTIFSWHEEYLVNGFHAVIKRFGDVHVLDPLNKELRSVRCVFDVVDGHVIVKAVEWYALS
jgi:hypothetical protein